MTQEQRAIHRTLAISESLGCRPPTSKQIDYACAVERFETPSYDWALYLVALLAFVVIGVLA